MVTLGSRAVVTAWLLASCASPASCWPPTTIGARDWLGPTGGGQLCLRGDSTFLLTLAAVEGPGESIAGVWTWQPARWPLVDSGPLEVDDSGMVQLHVHGATAAQSHFGGTTITALLGSDHATYLGTDGAIDLNWGW